MKKQNLLFFPLLLGMGIGVFSCNIGSNPGNYQNFTNTPAVVDQRTDMGGIVIGTPWGYLAAPELIDVYPGDCIYLYQFTIDYDNQPSDKYYTATSISKENVDQSNIEVVASDSIDLGDYILPISGVSSMADEFFLGRLFVGMSCKDKNPSFRLVYNTKGEATNGIKNLYLQAGPSSSTASTADVAAIHAFNLLSFIQQYGGDTTKTFKGSADKFDFKFIKANLNYVSGVTDGKPTYTMMNSSSNPIEIYVFKN